MLSILIFLPIAVAALVVVLPRRPALIRAVSFAGSLAALAIAIWVSLPIFRGGQGYAQVFPWIAAIGAEYSLRLDGISMPLVLLTTFLTSIALLYSLYGENSTSEHR